MDEEEPTESQSEDGASNSDENKQSELEPKVENSEPSNLIEHEAVSYTHLTLPTKA